MSFSKPSNTQKNNLNRNSRAYANLGDVVQNAPVSGSFAVTASQAAASAIVVQTNLSTIRGKMVQIFVSGSPVSASGIYVSTIGSNINITPVNGYKCAANDQINYVVF